MIEVLAGKNLEEVLEKAKNKYANNDFCYTVIKNDTDKDCEVEFYSLDDVALYGKQYLENGLKTLDINAEITYSINKEEKVINISINSQRNSILIGSLGKTLKAFGTLLRLIISNRFKKKYKVFLDIGNYRNKTLSKAINIGRKMAREAINNRCSIKLDPMTNEERKAIHNALADIKEVSTESVGEDEKNRYIIIHFNGIKDTENVSDIKYYKDFFNDSRNQTDTKDDNKYYKNEFKRYDNNSFNEFFHRDKMPTRDRDSDDLNIFSNLSFLKKDKNESSQDNNKNSSNLNSDENKTTDVEK